MSKEMRLLLDALVVSSRAQIRLLERQIKDINGLLYVDENTLSKQADNLKVILDEGA